MRALMWFWPAWLMVGLAYEVWAVWGRRAGGDTLSEFTLYVFRANSTIGWVALMLLMGFLAAWFPNHVRHLDDGIHPVRIASTQRSAAVAFRPPPRWPVVMVAVLLAAFMVVLLVGGVG